MSEMEKQALSEAICTGNGDLRVFDKCRNFTRAREVQAMGIYPYFMPISDMKGPEVVIGGRSVVMVGSNNYLGLTRDPRVVEAGVRALRKFGSGCTGSRFLNGTLELHEELEARLARFTRRESCLTFSTGFQTNLGVISTLVGKNDVVFCDRENHASIYDGCRLSYGQLRKYRHNDMDDLERILEMTDPDVGKFLAVDGMFSMSGELADLPRITELADRHGVAVMVDDAHGLGVMGPTGRGTAEHFGLEDDVDLILGTFSKSFGGMGGFISSSDEVIHYIKHHARSLIFSASMTPASVATVLAALDIIEQEPERLERLWRNVRKMDAGFRSLGFNTLNSRTPVIPILIGEDMTLFAFWKALYDGGVYTNPVIPPAVPPDQCLVRTSYMSTHEDSHLDRILSVFERVGREFGVI